MHKNLYIRSHFPENHYLLIDNIKIDTPTNKFKPTNKK